MTAFHLACKYALVDLLAEIIQTRCIPNLQLVDSQKMKALDYIQGAPLERTFQQQFYDIQQNRNAHLSSSMPTEGASSSSQVAPKIGEGHESSRKSRDEYSHDENPNPPKRPRRF